MKTVKRNKRLINKSCIYGQAFKKFAIRRSSCFTKKKYKKKKDLVQINFLTKKYKLN